MTVLVGGMLKSIALVVLLPVIAGVVVNRFAGSRLGQVQSWMPSVSVLAILVIIVIVVALNAGRLATVGLGLVVAVMLHNGLGLTLGYWGARAFGQDAVRARTLAIEVGMQNSGLAAALALKSFPAAAALPGALFSVWHNLSGTWAKAGRRWPRKVQTARARSRAFGSMGSVKTQALDSRCNPWRQPCRRSPCRAYSVRPRSASVRPGRDWPRMGDQRR